MGIPGDLERSQENKRQRNHHLEPNTIQILTTLVYVSLLKEIGKGERIALSRLSIEHLQKHSRPLRIAIDAAIWNFQTQHGGQGGKNPALRTLFYRLIRLLALPIQPVFVYDGKNKPLTKRGRTVSRWHGGCTESEMSKVLISLFRFPTHVAPGEAEAECAMLQRKGVVDAVMTQDVDAIMFGSGLTLRDWSKEANGRKGNNTPTHVNVLDLARVNEMSGLDPEGMILVALLSGGDYDEAGVAGIGCTLACEIARAGFGNDLLELIRNGDEDGIRDWRERLQFELEANESGYFKMKRKSIRIPDNFPDRKILGYYMNPAVTPPEELKSLESKWVNAWEAEVNIRALREYVAEMFEWLYKPGAWKFVRVMAPALLANQLRRGTAPSNITSVEQITERRQHFVSDGIPELRITVIPAEVVGLDLDAEEDSPEYLQLLAEEENEAGAAETEHGGIEENAPLSPCKKRKSPPWLPDAPEKMWIAQTIVELGALEHVERWKQIQSDLDNDPKKFATRKCQKQKETKKLKAAGGMQQGALLSYVVAANKSTEPKVHNAKSIASPPRPRANMSAPRMVKSPTKLESSLRVQHPDSPTMLDFFKSTKSSQLSDLVRTSINNGDDPFILDDETRGDKHSRPSISSSSEVGRRIVQSPAQPHGNGSRSISQNATRSKPKDLASVTQSDSTSSPMQRDLDSTVDRQKAEEALDLENKLGNVTRRTPKRRAKKYGTLAENESPNESPARPQRRVASFFKPYVRAKAPPVEVASSEDIHPAGVPPKLPPRPSKTSSATTHIHAIPRSSLPGTWKEVDCESGPSCQTDPSLPSRPPRVSIVDLTTN
ncbi:uncharacterized protein A1O5_02165 [Cladophialophora psammophila CBS 110553]|uniref:XPG-I domain-containing protein n=1 Tax=Cladophialophora psammophila CBS 110553 TaxID=1182543 RepID=W9XYY4_9EURO|nr:uncharacterized protein A1O5_02165 [Cladophialophora psammophila CBS 110553]EXJ75469.1 hypothetical protein A1O5_02165 [Cladophialophora psammophila CBS 110553]